MKIKTSRIVWAIAILMVLCCAGYFFGYKYAQSKISSTDKRQEMPLRRTTLGTMGLSLEVPEPLLEERVQLPENVQQSIELIEVFAKEHKNGLSVSATSMKYKPVIDSISLSGGATGAINGMKNVQGVTDFDYQQSTSSKNNIPGYIQRGKYKQNGKDFAFINAGYGIGLLFWQVTVTYRPHDEGQSQLAEKIVRSMEWSGSPQ